MLFELKEHDCQIHNNSKYSLAGLDERFGPVLEVFSLHE